MSVTPVSGSQQPSALDRSEHKSSKDQIKAVAPENNPSIEYRRLIRQAKEMGYDKLRSKQILTIIEPLELLRKAALNELTATKEEGAAVQAYNEKRAKAIESLKKILSAGPSAATPDARK